jgi:hypothetical protein
MILPHSTLSCNFGLADNERQPQNIKGGIYQQPHIGTYSNFKLKFIWPKHILKILQMKTTSNGRWTQNIKCGESQISNLSLYGQTLCSKGRWPPMENSLKILEVEA